MGCDYFTSTTLEVSHARGVEHVSMGCESGYCAPGVFEPCGAQVGLAGACRHCGQPPPSVWSEAAQELHYSGCMAARAWDREVVYENGAYVRGAYRELYGARVDAAMAGVARRRANRRGRAGDREPDFGASTRAPRADPVRVCVVVSRSWKR